MAEKIGSWQDYVIATTSNGCLRRFRRNDPLIRNLSRIFTYLCGNLELVYNYGRSLHVFINRALPEADILLSEGQCQIGSSESDRKLSHSRYHRLKLSDEEDEALRQITGWDRRVAKSTDVPLVSAVKPDDLLRLCKTLRIRNEPSEQEAGFLVPFDFAGLNMGLFLLWGKRENTRSIESPENEKLRGWVASTYFFLKDFLEREYTATDATYLPSFYAARWARAAILFADIRNFAHLTEILRYIYTRPGEQEAAVLVEIQNTHCRKMAKIIQEEGQGRIDRFFGAGVTAIFGEHEDNPSKAACQAVYAACRMVKRFRTLKSDFLKRSFGGDYELEYNESVDIELGVGVDFGTVRFDYLGDERHREYTVIGDHVYFARQLESEALRIDMHTNRQRPAILLSPTVMGCVAPWIMRSERIGIATGNGFVYTVYGIDSGDFDESLFLSCVESDDWSKPWTERRQEPPMGRIRNEGSDVSVQD